MEPIGEGRREKMQMAGFGVGDVTTDRTSGRTPAEDERVQATLTMAEPGAGDGDG